MPVVELYNRHEDEAIASKTFPNSTTTARDDVSTTRFANTKEEFPDIQIFFAGFLANCARTGQVGEREDGGNGTTPTQRVINFTPTVLHPRSRGTIRLRSRDPFAPPVITARYLTDPQDVEVLVDGIKIAIKLSEAKAFEKYGLRLDRTPVRGCETLEFGCDAYWRCAVTRDTGPENHQAGSCRMGPPGDPGAVVDPELRVHGIDRLRVMDASVMPRVTSGNTNAPTIMIAEKGSDMTKNRWLGPHVWRKW